MSLALHHTPALPTTDPALLRVMVVDDAVVVRGLVSRWLAEQPGLAVVDSLRTGRQAVDQLERVDPDVVVLDVDMPDLDGIAALPLLLEKKRDLVVIMASTLTRRNAEISLRALSLGAADYIPKPGSNREVSASTAFRRDLIEKIRELGLRARRLRRTPLRPSLEVRSAPPIVPHPIEEVAAPPPISLRPMPTLPPKALVLTGMGSDSLAGSKSIIAAGGHVMAQDEETSVVWGMPGQVTNAGLCSAVLPLSEIAAKLTRLFTGERV